MIDTEQTAELVIAPVSFAWENKQRWLDAALVISTACLWLPLLLLLLALKRLLDGSPVLFHQIRVGRDGREFVLHKIRTTPADFAPRPDDWPDAHYPPRTRFGQWLRRFDLDELPQLWNVLRGEMSLVGPRPETPYHCERLTAVDVRYPQRHLVRPGLTGHAQVHGFRGNTSVAGRLKMDLEYISRQGLGMYSATLFRTITVELRQWKPVGQVPGVPSGPPTEQRLGRSGTCPTRRRRAA